MRALIFIHTDNRITGFATAKLFEAVKRPINPVFIFNGTNGAIAIFVFRHCVYRKNWIS